MPTSRDSVADDASATSVAYQDADALADGLNELLDELHDPVVSADPFAWTDEESRIARARETLEVVAESLREYRHRRRLPSPRQLLFLLGTATLATLGGFVAADTPDQGLRTAAMILTLLLVGVLGLAVLFLIRRPAVDLDLGLALYTVPRGWSFSRINGRNVWERYAERYGAFIRGDKDQSIPLRLWGRLDDASSRAFQMFQFRWVDIEYHIRTSASGGKSAARTEAVAEHPSDDHGA